MAMRLEKPVVPEEAEIGNPFSKLSLQSGNLAGIGILHIDPDGTRDNNNQHSRNGRTEGPVAHSKKLILN